MARARQQLKALPAGGPAQPQELPMEANPNPAEVNPEKSEAVTEPTIDASAAPQDTVPEYPKDLYDAAHIENGHRNFNDRLLSARSPPKVEYVPPPVASAVARQTELEMQAGAKRVAEFAVIRQEQRDIAARTKEPWEGKTVPVFRPPVFTEHKDTFKSPAQTVRKDAVRQPASR